MVLKAGKCRCGKVFGINNEINRLKDVLFEFLQVTVIIVHMLLYRQRFILC